tara:strand:+ start:7028 stop:8239 length:1212 start_codon:yes stop_codon:yes gene_type:complete
MIKNIKPWVVIITAGRWNKICIKEAQSKGFNVIAIDEDPNAPGLRLANVGIVKKITSTNEIVSEIKSLGIVPLGILGFVSDKGAIAAASLRSAFALQGDSKELCERMANKESQRKIWDKNGIKMPKWQAFQSIDEILKQINQDSFPLVIKPIDSSGSRGVKYIDSKDNFIQSLSSAFKYSESNKVIIESFIKGEEYSVETFHVNGKMHLLTINHRTRFNFTTASEIRTAVLPERIKSKIESSTDHALKALGYKNGPAHTELIINEDEQPVLIETAGRGGGYRIFDSLIKHVCGFDIVYATLIQAIGEQPIINLEETNHRFASLKFITGKSGKVDKVILPKNDTFRLKDREILEYEIMVKDGESVRKAKNDTDRIGYIYSVADSMGRSEQLLRLAESNISIKII